MDRRAFIALMGGSMLAAPLTAEAQQARVYRIGVLGPTPIAPSSDAGFRKGLGQFGYTDGRNLVIEYRDGEGTRLTELAGDLVRLNIDVIYARGPAAVRAAQGATHTIPVVAIDLESDPVAAGFVRGLAKPGGNITGVFLDFARARRKATAVAQGDYSWALPCCHSRRPGFERTPVSSDGGRGPGIVDCRPAPRRNGCEGLRSCPGHGSKRPGHSRPHLVVAVRLQSERANRRARDRKAHSSSLHVFGIRRGWWAPVLWAERACGRAALRRLRWENFAGRPAWGVADRTTADVRVGR